MVFPTQGIAEYPNIKSFMQRGTSPLTLWYVAGAANQTALGTLAVSANQLYAIPDVMGRGGILDTIAFEVTTLAGGSSCRVGLYTNANDNAPYPGTLVVDSGVLSGGSTGVKSLTGIGGPWNQGLYWWVFESDGTPTVRSVAVGGQSHLQGLSSALALQGALTKAFTFAALPTTFPSGATYAATAAYPAIAHYHSS